jgi:hypothetical protein
VSAVLLAAIVVGQVSLALAAVALSRVVHTLQLDARSPGPMVDHPERRLPMLRPPALEAVERLVVDAVASDVVASRQLQPLLGQLGRTAPGGRVVVPPPGRDRRRWLAEAVAELEVAWDLSPPG